MLVLAIGHWPPSAYRLVLIVNYALGQLGSIDERRRKKGKIILSPCIINTIHVAKFMSFKEVKGIQVSSVAPPTIFACVEPPNL